MKKGTEIKTKIHSPFSPLLMEYTMPQHYVDKLNTYGDRVYADEIKSKNLDSSSTLVGNVKQEHAIEDHIWHEKINEDTPSYFQWVGGCVSLYIQTIIKRNKYSQDEHGESVPANETEKQIMKQGIKTLKVLKSWIVNSVAGDFNPTHHHIGGLSAAGWLIMPESIVNNQEREYAGWIEFMYGESLSLLNNKHPIKPQVGQLFLFPSWLQHTVYPFRGSGTRRSISFNVDFTV